MTSKKKILLWLAGLSGFLALGLLIYLDIVVTQKFSGRKWRLPSLVFARPLELYQGKELDIDHLKKELRESGYRKVTDLARPGDYVHTGNNLEIFRRRFLFWDGSEEAVKVAIDLSSGVVDTLKVEENSADIVRLEPMLIGGIYPHDFEDRKLIQLKNVPQYLVDALIVTEDQGFYSHFGVSIKGIVRAAYTNIKKGRYAQGASTITQQLVKNFYLNSDRTLKRKILEAIYSVLLEVHYSKDEILETYMNEVYLGQNGPRAIHGFGLASEFYFSKKIEDLSLDESALLVAIVNGPSTYNPRKAPRACFLRRNKVLEMMLAQGKITPEQFSESSKKPIKVAEIPSYQSLKFPGYLDLVKRHLSRDYQDEDLQQEGMRIFTSFDPISQWATEKAVKNHIAAWGNAGKPLEAAAIVASYSGDIEAIVPGKQSGFAGYNRALDTKRQIGSLVKPAVLLAALASDQSYHLATKVDDSSVSLTLDNGKVWNPQNYDGQDHGSVLLYQALAQSYNQAFVRLGLDVGPEKVRAILQALGVEEDVPVNPAMLLGSFGLSPLSVLTMFQTIAAGGILTQPRTIRYVVDYEGEIVQAYPVTLNRTISKNQIHLLHYALQTVMYEGTGKSAYRYLDKSFNTAGKTGTSNNKRDSWFAGFSGDKVSVVWLGRDDNKPTPLTGSSGALQIWTQIIKTISVQPFQYQQMSDMEYLWVDEVSGGKSMEICQQVRQIPFQRGKVPQFTATCIKSVKPILDWFKNLFEE